MKPVSSSSRYTWRPTLFLVWSALGIFGLSASFLGYAAEAMGIMGCVLCQIERIMFAVVGVFSAAAAYRHPWARWACLLWGLNGALGWYHTGLQYHLWSPPAFCKVSETQGGTSQEQLEKFLQEAPRPSCAEKTFVVAGLPGAFWVGTLSSLAFLLGLWALRRRPKVSMPFQSLNL